MARKPEKSPGPPKVKRIRAPHPVVEETAVDEAAAIQEKSIGNEKSDAPRLDEWVASRTVHARREVQQLIRSGHVKLDGIVVTEPGMRIEDAELLKAKGVLFLDGRSLDRALPAVTYALHKTKDTISTRRDPGNRRTVMDLIPFQLRQMGLVPVGRLDADTTGLLLLSSEGELTHQLTHPSHRIPKVYQVTVRGRVTPHQRFRLEHGVEIDRQMTMPAEVDSIRNDRDTTSFLLTIYEGRNRQIKHMCRKVGLEVIRLHRISVGPIELGDLRPGKWREISKDEMAELRSMLDSGPPRRPHRSGARNQGPSDRRPQNKGPRRRQAPTGNRKRSSGGRRPRRSGPR